MPINRYNIKADHWLLVCLSDETEQYRGTNEVLELETFYEDSTMLKWRIHGLTYGGEDFDKIIVGFKNYALLCKVGAYMMVFPAVGLVDKGNSDQTSYFIPVGADISYHVWKIENE